MWGNRDLTESTDSVDILHGQTESSNARPLASKLETAIAPAADSQLPSLPYCLRFRLETAYAKASTLETIVTSKVDGLKWKFWPAFGNHMLSGLASVIVALLIFGCFSLYNMYQQQGGLEGMAKQASNQANQQPADLSTTPSLPQSPQG